MNELAYTKEYAEAHEALGLVEILDADGNPTGFYEASAGEAAPQEAEVFISEDTPSHAIN